MGKTKTAPFHFPRLSPNSPTFPEFPDFSRLRWCSYTTYTTCQNGPAWVQTRHSSKIKVSLRHQSLTFVDHSASPLTNHITKLTYTVYATTNYYFVPSTALHRKQPVLFILYISQVLVYLLPIKVFSIPSM